MSNIPAKSLDTDFTEDDKHRIVRYQDEGLPGISSVAPEKIKFMTEAYIDGKSYREISSHMRVKLDIVLYLANKYNWFEMKQEFQKELVTTINKRMTEAKLRNKDFLIQLTQFFKKKFANKISKYYETNDEAYADQINLKELDKFYKAVELLEKVEGAKLPKTPVSPIGLNLGLGGVNIQKKDDGSVDITPKDESSSFLERYANLRREQENSSRDIKEEETNPKGDDDEES